MKFSLDKILLLIFLLLPVFVFAQGLGIPHQFYGQVTFTNGVTPDGLLVEAKIDNSTVGNSVTADGKYGYTDLLLAADPQGTNAGKTVEFYVSGIKANETAIFENGSSTEFNLMVSGTIGIIEETDENETIENKTAVVTPTQTANIKLGTNLNITVSSETNTNATINQIKKLTSDFFTGATAVIAGSNLLNAFEIDITGDDLNISVTITYDDTGIDEDTIKPYEFDGSSWVAFNSEDYNVNKSANTITFTISSAETPYAVFGSEPEPEPTPPAGGGGGGGVYTPPPTYKTGDTNKDGKVDKYDFALMMAAWGKTGTNLSDLNNDNKVDKYDFALLMSNWSTV